jgi:alpha-beta hydrolase superfamily lysophospholipase
VVIFQHGITRNRTDIFAIASTLCYAGFVTVAIDLPLHGLPSSNKFYKNQFSQLLNTEVARFNDQQ